MLSSPKEPQPVSKTFYSERLVVRLIFHHKGGLEGQVYPYSTFTDISMDVSGLYRNNDNSVYVGFACGFHRPDNKIAGTSVFTGEIFRYDLNRECLIVKWWTLTDDGTEAQHSDIDVLLDSDERDLAHETSRIREYIHRYDVMMC